MTEDSFSDAGRFVEPDAAIAQARRLYADGAQVIDLGAASSKPGAKPVPADIEIQRLGPVIAALKRLGVDASVDSYAPEVQRWAIAMGAAYINDVRGFPDPSLYPALAESGAKLIVMHSLEGLGPATSRSCAASQIMDRVLGFFRGRIDALSRAGIARDRLILDPGMGFFLGRDTDASLEVLRHLDQIRSEFGLPILISVSRKSFLRKLANAALDSVAPASLAAELFAWDRGAAMIRTHEPGQLIRAVAVWRALMQDRAGD